MPCLDAYPQQHAHSLLSAVPVQSKSTTLHKDTACNASWQPAHATSCCCCCSSCCCSWRGLRCGPWHCVHAPAQTWAPACAAARFRTACGAQSPWSVHGEQALAGQAPGGAARWWHARLAHNTKAPHKACGVQAPLWWHNPGERAAVPGVFLPVPLHSLVSVTHLSPYTHSV